MGTIKVTLETLYDVLRNEKKREDLQKLEETFFLDIILYLQEKQALLKTMDVKESIFAAGEKEKLEYELRSIRRILKEIYEKREKKIIDIALNRSKTRSEIIDTTAMLREEKDFYEKILATLDLFREKVLFRLFNGQLPEMAATANLEATALPLPTLPFGKKTTAEEESNSSLADDSLGGNDSLSKIRFIRPVPSFIWKDMKVYGPYDTGEIIEIYREVADLLIRKERAQKIE